MYEHDTLYHIFTYRCNNYIESKEFFAKPTKILTKIIVLSYLNYANSFNEHPKQTWYVFI